MRRVSEAIATFWRRYLREAAPRGSGMADTYTGGLYAYKAPDRLPPDQKQYSKEQQNYRSSENSPPAPGAKCGNCRFFVKPGACQIVAGLIRPTDVCDAWQGGSTESDAVREFRKRFREGRK